MLVKKRSSKFIGYSYSLSTPEAAIYLGSKKILSIEFPVSHSDNPAHKDIVESLIEVLAYAYKGTIVVEPGSEEDAAATDGQEDISCAFEPGFEDEESWEEMLCRFNGADEL